MPELPKVKESMLSAPQSFSLLADKQVITRTSRTFCKRQDLGTKRFLNATKRSNVACLEPNWASLLQNTLKMLVKRWTLNRTWLMFAKQQLTTFQNSKFSQVKSRVFFYIALYNCGSSNIHDFEKISKVLCSIQLPRDFQNLEHRWRSY